MDFLTAFRRGALTPDLEAFYFMVQQYFTPPVLFQIVLIKIDKAEVLFFKNNETECFYYFDTDVWHSNFKSHMMQKNWFTSKMADFITSNI